jgi:predicted transcriptional regulator
MTNTKPARLKNLGDAEQQVMDYFWTHGPSTSEACREALASSRPMKDSTIRTVLRRLEEKGYLAVKGIIDRFCGGSAEQLVLGMVNGAVLDRKQLERLTRKIAESNTAEISISEKRPTSKRESKP